MKAHCAKKNQISQLWNLIETWGFLVDLQILADRSRLLNIRSCFITLLFFFKLFTLPSMMSSFNDEDRDDGDFDDAVSVGSRDNDESRESSPSSSARAGSRSASRSRTRSSDRCSRSRLGSVASSVVSAPSSDEDRDGDRYPLNRLRASVWGDIELQTEPILQN